MVSIDICGYCKHYRGLKDGWLIHCDAYPDGLPIGFGSEPNKKCSDNVSFVVKDDKKVEYDKFFK